ncbi:hypothetical protein [Catenulispora pinisilvae]|uniref:hypothetical protein n=1 Tax=Catenulispora pinisilvae TaxID=2705253 RepID=UPI0018926EEE|nr:hypothetical protein [Catenulispora pinisilvae]
MPQTTFISTKRPVRALTMTIAVGAVAGLSLTACSSSGSTGGGTGGSKNPTEALAAAVHNINSGNAEAFQLSLKPDDAMIAAMNKDSDPQSAQIAKSLFSNGGIVVKFTASSDKPLKDLKAGENPNVELDLTAGGTDFLDVRMVGGALYAKANMPQFLQLAGKSASDLNSQLSQAPADFQAPLQALMAGKWVGVSASDVKNLEQMAQNLGNSDLGGSSTAPSTSAGTQMLAGIESNLMKALTQDATVTDKGSGQYEVSGKVKVIGQDVLQAITPTLSAVPGKSKADIDKLRQGLNSVPDSENVTFNVWLKSGQISELQVDLAQFLPSSQTGGGHLPVDAKFSQTAGAVTAPGDVTNIDVQKLMSSFGQGL